MKRLPNHRILIEGGDTPWGIAQALVGDGSRYEELIVANPEKRTTRAGNFVTLIAGEVLRLPLSWPEPKAAPEERFALGLSGKVPQAEGLPLEPPHVPNGADAGALPYGWTQDDVDIVSNLAKVWGANPDDLFVTWFEESGLQPRAVVPFGSGKAPDGGPTIEYAGIIAGLSSQFFQSQNARQYPIDQSMGWKPGTWKTIVTQTPLASQLQAIALIWDRLFKIYLKTETIGQFARRMGVSVAAVIHALNFLPARVPGLQSRDSAITKSTDKDPGTRTGSFYGDNSGLDMNGDGKITLADLDAHGQKKLAELKASNLGPIVAAAQSEPKQGLAALFSPIAGVWQSLTGKPPTTNLGYQGAQATPSAPSASSGGGALVVAGAALAAVWYFFLRKRKRRG